MKNTQEDALANLQEIHLPDAVSLWPSAPGWWVLLLSIVIAIYVLQKLLINLIRKNSYRRLAVKHLMLIEKNYQSHKKDQQLLTEINQLLKSVAIRHFPQWQCASFSEKKWQAFLTATLPAAKRQPSDLFVELSCIYQREVNLSEAQCLALIQSTQLWLKKHQTNVIPKESNFV
ncbi:MAG: hypothetical protein ACI9ES_000926 [Oceanospirillaceae bacterium]|jgi:hypothetical protein